MTVTWYTAMSMDGRIADAHGSLDFLSTIEASEPSGGEDPWSFESFLSRVDAAVIGASTLRWLLGEAHGWPHDDLPTWLISHDTGLARAVGSTRAPFVRREGDIGAVFDEIDAAHHTSIWLCGGGDVAGQALAGDHVDDVVVTIAPTVLGRGPALFDADGLTQRRFQLAECRPLGGDAARLRWSRQRIPPP